MGLFRTISRSLIYILIFRHTGRTVLDQLGPTVKQLGPKFNWGMFHLYSGKDQENSNRVVGF